MARFSDSSWQRFGSVYRFGICQRRAVPVQRPLVEPVNYRAGRTFEDRNFVFLDAPFAYQSKQKTVFCLFCQLMREKIIKLIVFKIIWLLPIGTPAFLRRHAACVRPALSWLPLGIFVELSSAARGHTSMRSKQSLSNALAIREQRHRFESYRVKFFS